jgi:hypothetical protein
MKQQVFTHILDKLRDNSKRIDELYELGIDLINFSDDSNEVINILLEVYYGKEGADWISWYLWEHDIKRGKYQATDKDGNLICYDDRSLWEEVERCRLENKTEYELPIPMTDEERKEMLDMIAKRF